LARPWERTGSGVASVWLTPVPLELLWFAMLGSPISMSPEQASGQKGIDGRSDIFSLACVLYELPSGKPPYYGATPQAALKRRFSGPPMKLRPLAALRD
jgi:serine/threonine protein kinase